MATPQEGNPLSFAYGAALRSPDTLLPGGSRASLGGPNLTLQACRVRSGARETNPTAAEIAPLALRIHAPAGVAFAGQIGESASYVMKNLGAGLACVRQFQHDRSPDGTVNEAGL